MFHLDLGEVRQLDDLGQQLYKCQHLIHACMVGNGHSYLEGRRDHCLTGHNGRKNSDDQTGIEHARWDGVEERVGVGTLVLTDVCSLTDVLHMSYMS